MQQLKELGDIDSTFLDLLCSAASKTVYPLRIGIVGDLGQTVNSSQTRNHLRANKPQVIINAGDLSYADHYIPSDPNAATQVYGEGSNQMRWDSFIQLWTSLFSTVPQLHSIGDHEIESGAINAKLDYRPTDYQYPSNYPFQAYSARFPVPVSRGQLRVFLIPDVCVCVLQSNEAPKGRMRPVPANQRGN